MIPLTLGSIAHFTLTEEIFRLHLTAIFCHQIQLIVENLSCVCKGRLSSNKDISLLNNQTYLQQDPGKPAQKVFLEESHLTNFDKFREGNVSGAPCYHYPRYIELHHTWTSPCSQPCNPLCRDFNP